MDNVLDQPWTVEGFLAWEDRQEARHEFNGRQVIPMTGGSIAHQTIMVNLCIALRALLLGKGLLAVPEMRLRIGSRVRYPDVLVAAGPLDQTTKTLTDALAIFEVASDETGATDRAIKLLEYAEVPSLRCYAVVEQAARGVTLFRPSPNGEWIATGHTEGALTLPGLDVSVPLAELYQGLVFEGGV